MPFLGLGVMSLISHSGAGGIFLKNTNECSRALFVPSLSFFLFNESRQMDAYGGHLKDVNSSALASSLMDT